MKVKKKVILDFIKMIVNNENQDSPSTSNIKPVSTDSNEQSKAKSKSPVNRNNKIQSRNKSPKQQAGEVSNEATRPKRERNRNKNKMTNNSNKKATSNEQISQSLNAASQSYENKNSSQNNQKPTNLMEIKVKQPIKQSISSLMDLKVNPNVDLISTSAPSKSKNISQLPPPTSANFSQPQQYKHTITDGFAKDNYSHAFRNSSSHQIINQSIMQQQQQQRQSFQNEQIQRQTSLNLKNRIDQLRNLEKELECNHVFKSKKMQKYRCDLCNYFCNTVDVASKHIEGEIHKNNFEALKLEIAVRELEMPASDSLDHLSTFLADFYLMNVIASGKLKFCYETYQKFKTRFLGKFPAATINIYGSMAYGLCTEHTTCDISVEFSEENRTSEQILADVEEFVRSEMSDVFASTVAAENQQPTAPNTIATLNQVKSPKISNKKSRTAPNASCNASKLVFEAKSDEYSTAKFQFTSGAMNEAHKTSTLLRAYMQLDERAKILAFGFRYMAKIAKIDKSDLCFLPPHAYVIMVIHFLQRLDPPLFPVLHEILRPKQQAKLKKKQHQREKSDSITIKIENEHENESEIEISENNYELFREKLQNYVQAQTWQSQNKSSVAELWLKCLAFYSVDFGFKKTLITIRQRKQLSKASVKMYTKKFSVEDPFHLNQNLSRNLPSMTNKYIVNIVRKSCLYFTNSTLQLKSAEASNYKIIEQLIDETGIQDAKKYNTACDDSSSSEEDDVNEDASEEKDIDDSEDDNKSTISSSGSAHLKNQLANNEEHVADATEIEEDEEDQEGISFDDGNIFASRQHVAMVKIEAELIKRMNLASSESSQLSSLEHEEAIAEAAADNRLGLADNGTDLENLRKSLNQVVNNALNSFDLTPPKTELSTTSIISADVDSHSYRFTPEIIGFPSSPPKICSSCNKDGHLFTECTQNQTLVLDALPELTDEWRILLNGVCLHIMDENSQTREEEAIRDKLLKEIRSIVAQKYSNAKLSLFGSSNNGFAMKKSDLDICMTLDEDPSKVNFKRVIRNLGALFRQERERFVNIEERVSAKVPIVKFLHRHTMIEGDISLYNTLALHNTELLRSYVQIDSRTKTLGYVVKHFAKICNIGDASCGTLSSYAYIIMMIHYLMSTSPPVLPCLQELNRQNLSREETNVIVDTWNCWFHRDIANLGTAWAEQARNEKSVGELWLGFLRYYTEEFDWTSNVVSIRSSSQLSREKKNWTKFKMAIEDPFELSHNLAAGVSPRTGHFIITCFAKARKLFGDVKPNEASLNINYFFNPKELVQGALPMDRSCYSCNKIGHLTRDCPLRKKQQSNDTGNFEQNSNGIECFRCRQVGHKAKDCQVRQKTASVSISGNEPEKPHRCFECGQSGHLIRNCKNQQHQTQVYVNSYNNFNAPKLLSTPQQAKFNQQQQQQQSSMSSHSQQAYYMPMPSNVMPIIQDTIVHQQSAPQPKIINLNAMPSVNGLAKTQQSRQFFNTAFLQQNGGAAVAAVLSNNNEHSVSQQQKSPSYLGYTQENLANYATYQHNHHSSQFAQATYSTSSLIQQQQRASGANSNGFFNFSPTVYYQQFQYSPQYAMANASHTHPYHQMNSQPPTPSYVIHYETSLSTSADENHVNLPLTITTKTVTDKVNFQQQQQPQQHFFGIINNGNHQEIDIHFRNGKSNETKE